MKSRMTAKQCYCRKSLFWILSASFFLVSCTEQDINVPDPNIVRTKHHRIVDSLKKELSLDPKNHKLLLDFGKACLAKSRFERELFTTGISWGTIVHPKLVEAPLVDALPLFDRAVEHDSSSANVHALLGRINLELWVLKRLVTFLEFHPLKDKAEKALSTALKLDSLHVDAMIDLSRLRTPDRYRMAESDELLSAEELSMKAIQVNPQNGIGHFRYAQVLAHKIYSPMTTERNELYRKATTAYRHAIELGLDNATPYLVMADFFDQSDIGSYTNFYSFQRSFGFIPGFIKGFFLAGLGLTEMSGREKAGRLASRALDLNPLYPAALMIQCDVYDSRGKSEKAVEYFLKATQLNPAVEGSYYVTKSSFLEKVISVEPKSYVAHARLGQILLNQGRADPTTHIKKALEIKPDYAKAWLLLARVYENNNLIAEADTAYNRALALPWDRSLNFHSATYFYVEHKKFDKAVAIAERQIAEGLSDSSWAYWRLGIALEEVGQLNRAELYYNRALKSSDPNFRAIVAVGLSSVYVKKKQSVEAEARQAARAIRDH